MGIWPVFGGHPGNLMQGESLQGVGCRLRSKGIAMKGASPNRTVILAAGTLAAMGTSCIYMWSIFNKPLMAAYGFTASEVSMAYSLFLLATCFSSMLAGWLQRHVQPRFIVLCSGILFGLGWFLSGYASNLVMLYVFFGGMAGAGNGLLYNSIVAVVMKWFPDKRGFANGVCIGAIGLGPVFFAPLGNFLIESFSVQMAFHIVGVIWLVIYLAVSWLLLVPPQGWTPVGQAEKAEEANSGDALRERNLTSRQMFRQPLYYVLFLVMMVACTSGLMVTSHASNIGQEVAGLTASEGAVVVAALAVGSCLGRFGFGAVSDRIGRYKALAISLAANAVLMLFCIHAATTFVTYLLAVAAVGACFGGTMTIVSAIVGDAFGSVNFGQNYSFVYPGYTVASFVGPMAAATAFEAVGSYSPAFVIAGALALVGVVLVLACSRLERRLPSA